MCFYICVLCVFGCVCVCLDVDVRMCMAAWRAVGSPRLGDGRIRLSFFVEDVCLYMNGYVCVRACAQDIM